MSLQRSPTRPGACIRWITEVIFIQELDTHGQGGGAVGLRGGEAEDVLDEAVELEARLVGVAGEQAVVLGLGQRDLGGTVPGFDLVRSIAGEVEQELGDWIRCEVGED